MLRETGGATQLFSKEEARIAADDDGGDIVVFDVDVVVVVVIVVVVVVVDVVVVVVVVVVVEAIVFLVRLCQTFYPTASPRESGGRTGSISSGKTTVAAREGDEASAGRPRGERQRRARHAFRNARLMQ